MMLLLTVLPMIQLTHGLQGNKTAPLKEKNTTDIPQTGKIDTALRQTDTRNSVFQQTQAEKRDTTILQLLRALKKQNKETERRDAILIDLIKTVKRQGEALERRDAVLSGLLRQVRHSNRRQNQASANIASNRRLENHVRQLSETAMHAWNPYGKCNGGYRIRVPGTYIRYPASGFYPNRHANCEWNVEIPGNVTLRFTHFDMNRRKKNYKNDYVAVYEGSSLVGRWDTLSRPPGLLTIKGTAKITFHSRRETDSVPGTGFGLYVDGENDI